MWTLPAPSRTLPDVPAETDQIAADAPASSPRADGAAAARGRSWSADDPAPGAPLRRCIWTGRVHRRATELVPASLPGVVVGGGRGPQRVDVEPAWEGEVRRWGAFVQRHVRRFQVLLGGLLAAITAAAVFAGPIATGAGVAALGLLVVVYPFSTPQTVRMLGIRRARAVTRGLGVATIVVGAVIAVL